MPICVRERDQQRFVARKVFKDTGEKLRLARGAANPLRTDAGDREKPAELLGFRREEGKGLNCQCFRRFGGDRIALRHRHLFAIP